MIDEEDDFDPTAPRITTGVQLLVSDQRGAIDWGTCCICNEKIKTMTFYGTGVCGDLHDKERERRRRAASPAAVESATTQQVVVQPDQQQSSS